MCVLMEFLLVLESFWVILESFFGSERSLRSADVVGGWVVLWVGPHYALQLF